MKMKFEEAINYINKELMYHILVISEGSGRGNASTEDVYNSMIYLRKNLSKIKECAKHIEDIDYELEFAKYFEYKIDSQEDLQDNSNVVHYS